MLVEAANRLNIQTVILDAPGAPAKQINALHPHINGSFSSADSIRELAKECDILTYEIEHVDTHVLQELHGKVEVCLLFEGRDAVAVANGWMITAATVISDCSADPGQILAKDPPRPIWRGCCRVAGYR